MPGKPRHDWNYWRFRYVTGDESLEALSESVENAPGLRAFKTRSASESWAEQRRQFRHQTIAKTAQDTTAQRSLEQTQKLVDAVEVIAQHLQLSKALKSIAARRLREFDPSELTPRDLVAWINAATTIDRLALGLSTNNVQMDVTLDMSKLSDEQLSRLAAGEDLSIVLGQSWQD